MTDKESKGMPRASRWIRSVLAGGVVALSPAACTPPADDYYDGCFGGRVRVLTPAGPVAIEALRVGDEVWSWDLARAAPVRRRVGRVWQARGPVRLTLAAGALRIAEVTPSHPVWEAGAATWRAVGELGEGAKLLVWHGSGDPGEAALERVEEVAEPSDGPVYNLSVRGPEQTFFVEGALVHNKSWDDDDYYYDDDDIGDDDDSAPDDDDSPPDDDDSPPDDDDSPPDADDSPPDDADSAPDDDDSAPDDDDSA